jgi:hypothetical protein
VAPAELVLAAESTVWVPMESTMNRVVRTRHFLD